MHCASGCASASCHPTNRRPRRNGDAGRRGPAEAAMTERWVPGATYRVQLHKGFGFDDAAAVVPYLKALGVDTLYTSPFLRARSESTHGYDVSDHAALNPALGG